MSAPACLPAWRAAWNPAARRSNPELFAMALALRGPFESACARARSASPGRGKPMIAVRPGRGLLHAAALLAAGRANAAFLPMDPANPLERDLPLAQSLGCCAMLMPGGELRLLDPPPGRALWPADCEYACLTGGSSGFPKCAVLPEGALARVACAQADLFGLRSLRCALWCLAPGWDASLSDIFAPLCAGLRLVPLPPELPATPKTIRSALLGLESAYLDLPAAYLPLFDFAKAGGLKTLAVGGQCPDPAGAARALEAGLRLFNCYGPTETAVCSNACEIFPGDPCDILGPELPGIRCELDPPGQGRGHIRLAGPNAMLGYRNSPEENLLRLSAGPGGERSFLTSDLAEQAATGLRFLGRSDRAGKIAGILVFAEEIEAAFAKAGFAAPCAALTGRKAAVFYRAAPPCRKAAFDAACAALPACLRGKIILMRGPAPLLANGKPDNAACKALASQPGERLLPHEL